jgi:hypothetical protein
MFHAIGNQHIGSLVTMVIPIGLIESALIDINSGSFAFNNHQGRTRAGINQEVVSLIALIVAKSLLNRNQPKRKVLNGYKVMYNMLTDPLLVG